MAATFNLQIVTLDQVAYDGEIESLVVPAEYGYLGVLARHAPLLAALVPGKLKVTTGGRDHVGKIDSGFVEVRDNKATLLVNSIEDFDLLRTGESE